MNKREAYSLARKIKALGEDDEPPKAFTAIHAVDLQDDLLNDEGVDFVTSGFAIDSWGNGSDRMFHVSDEESGAWTETSYDHVFFTEEEATKKARENVREFLKKAPRLAAFVRFARDLLPDEEEAANDP